MKRSLLAIIAPSLLLLAAALPTWGAEGEGSPDGTVVVTLAGGLPLRPAPDLFDHHELSLHEATVNLRKALRSSEKRVVIDLAEGWSGSLATAEELAAVLRSEKGTVAGRTVTCLLDGVNDDALVIASACDEVVMANAGLLDVHGIALESYYLADALAKVGIHFHAVASGEHKTAHEMFTRNSPSPAGVAEFEELAHNLDRVLLDLSQRQASGQRAALTREEIQAARAESPQTPAIASRLRLVDALAEPGAWLAKLPAPVRWQGEEAKSTPPSGMAGMMQLMTRLMQGDQGPKYAKAVAVIELAGEIVGGGDSSPGQTIAPDDTITMLEDIADDDRLQTVVLRIDSPGGDAGASDRIHHAVRRLAEKKPVVALFDSVAASGGYYIGCAADEIQVHRATITGSIGVFALVPDVSGALELLGIHRHGVTTGPRADLMSLTAPFSPEREAGLRQVIADVDDRFQALVAERRKIDRSKMPGLAGGRVYTGEQAVGNGLADSFGTLATAVAAARKRAKIDETLPLERYPKDKGLFGRLGFGGVQALLPPEAAHLQRLATAKRLQVMAWATVPTQH
jgi:protease IV